MDKPAGQPCVHLADSYACNIHSELRERGFKGCTVYDCLGAGQFVSQVTFHGRSWREDDVDGARMFATVPIMNQVHELLLYITDILTREIPEHDARLLETLLEELLAFRELAPEQLTGTALMAFRQQARPLFVRLSQHIRVEGLKQDDLKLTSRHEQDRADLIGRNLSRHDVRGTCYRGALLIGANLRGQDLSYVDFMGADVRDLDVRGAVLTDGLFLTQMQVNAMNGDRQTRLAPVYTRPSHWL
ncbi:pentapeptide repeat-containing protein [Exiguobacterium mexicanum]|uniref:Pentapeptide repeat-containing protein n=2 Tax=Bacillales Family XII. Incertae Sedis TaxID=539742 RepID=A0ABT7MMY0_9BACL|nr:pentapeptide repeat-containing protein [Exiguobacterium sp. s152]MDL5376548.1 pentapeptide repeat-containing protein [Exiguobacterium mexicanum]